MVQTRCAACQVLGIADYSDQEEIKQAHKRLARKYHPDKGGDAAEFRKVQEAYELLMGVKH